MFSISIVIKCWNFLWDLDPDCSKVLCFLGGWEQRLKGRLTSKWGRVQNQEQWQLNKTFITTISKLVERKRQSPRRSLIILMASDCVSNVKNVFNIRAGRGDKGIIKSCMEWIRIWTRKDCFPETTTLTVRSCLPTSTRTRGRRWPGSAATSSGRGSTFLWS